MPHHLFSKQKLNQKKMENVETKEEKKIELTPIKQTPFSYATNGQRNYIVCGRVIMETEKNLEETKEWISEKPWEAIGIMIQAIVDEFTKENNKK